MKKILSLSLILLCSLFLSACGVKPTNDAATTTSSDQQEESTTSSFSLRDLIAKNIPQKCTWSSNIEGSESNGTIIIQGQKFNQKVTIKQENQTFTTNSISDGVYIYTWQENPQNPASNVAIKMKLDNIENQKEEPQTSEYSASVKGVDFDQQYQYDCSPTVVSESDFQPPQGVEFMDYDEFLKDIQSKIPNIDVNNLEQYNQ